jgi:PleD family two-component response regulator
MKAFNYALRHPELFAVSGQETAGMPSKELALNLNVLLVDDNARFRNQLGRIIGKISPASMLYEAENLAETSRVAESSADIAFIDVVLEDEDGIQCASRQYVFTRNESF